MKLENRQAFAGSVATTDRLVRNMATLAGVSLCDAVTMMTRTPARVVGLDDRKGSIEVGYDADIVIMDQDLQVQSVMAMGKFIR
jgi:N-acetylglucosamine-6-phosphate deacetylase